jgi:OOP family OmpA-OmpF porin
MMIKKQLIALAVAGMSVMSIAQAEEFLDNRWYVAPFGTYVMPDGNRGVRDGFGGGLGVGKILNQHFNVELRGLYQEYSGFANINPGRQREGGDWRMAGGTVDLQYHFLREALMPYKLSPYTVIGAGAMNNWVPGASALSVIGEAGVGVTYELLDNLLLRTDVRYRYANDFHADLHSQANQHHEMVVNAGVVIPFGEKPKAAVKVEEPVPVPKAIDCSTLDDDNDSVNNCEDKCPKTPAGKKVDATGCQVIVLHGVNFAKDQPNPKKQAKNYGIIKGGIDILNGTAKELVASSNGGQIHLDGYTSSEGSDAYNMALSQRRVEAVMKYLKDKGVTNEIVPTGHGEENLIISPEKNESDREQNRRVEIHF